MRPFALPKLVKQYAGRRDPYDQMTAYKQAKHVEQVTDMHTQVEGFGLALKSKALTWCQALGP